MNHLFFIGWSTWLITPLSRSAAESLSLCSRWVFLLIAPECIWPLSKAELDVHRQILWCHHFLLFPCVCVCVCVCERVYWDKTLDESPLSKQILNASHSSLCPCPCACVLVQLPIVLSSLVSLYFLELTDVLSPAMVGFRCYDRDLSMPYVETGDELIPLLMLLSLAFAGPAASVSSSHTLTSGLMMWIKGSFMQNKWKLR